MEDRNKTINNIIKEVSELEKPLNLSEQLLNILTEMSVSERREIDSRVEVIITHLLKYDYQPANRSRSWYNTVKEQIRHLQSLLNHSPSLKKYFEDCFLDKRLYLSAVEAASDQTGLSEKLFPVDNPYTADIVITKAHSIFQTQSNESK